MNASEYFLKLTKYFRSSLLDAERLSPNTATLLKAIEQYPSPKKEVTKDVPFSVTHAAWELGYLDEETTQAIFKASAKHDRVNELELVLIPRIDLRVQNHGAAIGKQSPLLTPLIAEVRLSRTGELKPGNIPPSVPREYLAPNQSDQTPFTHVDVLDAFLTHHPFTADNWVAFKTYCQTMLWCLVTGTHDVKEHEVPESLFDCSLVDGYQLKTNVSLVMLEPQIKAGFHIRKIYDDIIRGQSLNPLFQRMFAPQSSQTKPYEDLTFDVNAAKLHHGQMTAEFPLADKQRNALHYITRMQDGDVLAINGPPGTGKTTLLRSVVANAWVNAALEEKEPPIIVAASSSNQAVTNILDSFQRIEETHIENALKGRWLPNLHTYGLYACGNNKANENNPYAYITKKGAGLMQAMENNEPIEVLIQHFLQCLHVWQGQSSIGSVDEAAKMLHSQLKACCKIQHTLPEYFAEMQALVSKCQKSYGSEHALNDFIHTAGEELTEIEHTKKQWQSVLDPFLTLWQKRPWWELLLSFLPPIKNKWSLSNELLARKHQLEVQDTSDQGIRSAIQSQVAQIDQHLKHRQQAFDEAKKLAESIKDLQQVLRKGFELIDLKWEAESWDDAKLINQIDIKLRFRAFKLATHYWEARWLQDMRLDIKPANTPQKRLNTYRRYAKLTPCFVSTFNMLPNFFEVSQPDGDGWKSTALVDGADLLIVDEAGQALPHIAAASFLIAKKALLVGDIYQIEPVWSISKGIDRANLAMHQLVTETFNYEDFWLNSEILASSGNLMALAHKHTQYQQFEDLECGLYLTEHRRCYDSIIHYCNQLVYKGHLEPMRGEPKHQGTLPTMGFVHHHSTSQRVGSSRINQKEAQFIGQWIKTHASLLATSKPLEQSVAVITPFSMQAKTIKKALKMQGLSGIKVGTVHTFQGAECDTILFSSVYASNDAQGSKFYDRSSHMLNVAVSRAKNHLIVIGDKQVFGSSGSSSPSGLLKQHLEIIHSNDSTLPAIH